MKRVLIGILALIMVLGLVGCGKSNEVANHPLCFGSTKDKISPIITRFHHVKPKPHLCSYQTKPHLALINKSNVL